MGRRPEQEDQMAHVVLEWEGMAAADLVADAVIAVILQVRPFSVRDLTGWLLALA